MEESVPGRSEGGDSCYLSHKDQRKSLFCDWLESFCSTTPCIINVILRSQEKVKTIFENFAQGSRVPIHRSRLTQMMMASGLMRHSIVEKGMASTEISLVYCKSLKEIFTWYSKHEGPSRIEWYKRHEWSSQSVDHSQGERGDKSMEHEPQPILLISTIMTIGRSSFSSNGFLRCEGQLLTPLTSP